MPSGETNGTEWGQTLADFTSPSLIIPFLQEGDAATVIQELSAAFQREGLLTDLLPFYQAVLNREYLGHTVAERGWAMPHAKAKGLNRPYCAGRWAPLKFWLSSAQPVSLVFLFAIPDTEAGVISTDFRRGALKQTTRAGEAIARVGRRFPDVRRFGVRASGGSCGIRLRQLQPI